MSIRPPRLGRIWRWLAGGLGLIVLLAGAAVWYGLAVPGASYRGPLPSATSAERELAQRLQAHLAAIASTPHNTRHMANLEAVERYIARSLADSGYAVERQTYKESKLGELVANLGATIEPSSPGGTQASTLVIGAHYDSCCSNCCDAPGANDNGTGTAAVLELARLLQDLRPAGTRLRFVLFVNEECPYCRTDDQGSIRYAKLLADRGETVSGMLSLETIGAFSDAPGSQKYPAPFKYLYPSTANFIAFVGLPGSRAFLHQVLAVFRGTTQFPTIGGLAPDVIPGIGWSDHWSFAAHGWPALMVTDTAFFRYPHYHKPTDTPDKVDTDKLARIVAGLERTIRAIAK